MADDQKMERAKARAKEEIKKHWKRNVIVKVQRTYSLEEVEDAGRRHAEDPKPVWNPPGNWGGWAKTPYSHHWYYWINANAESYEDVAAYKKGWQQGRENWKAFWRQQREHKTS